jgi:outer membrane protein TolC
MRLVRLARKLIPRPCTLGTLILVLPACLPFAPKWADAQQGRSLPIVTIGFVTDGPWDRLAKTKAEIEEEATSLLRNEFDVRFPETKQVLGDWTDKAVSDGINRLLADPEVDMVIALGVLASNDAAIRGDLPKPVLAPVVLDVELQGLPQEEGASGVSNLSYTAFPNPFRRDLEMFRRIVPFKKLALLSAPYYRDALQAFGERFPRIARDLGLEMQIILVGDSAEKALAQLDPDVEAVYLPPLLHLPDEEQERLIRGLIRCKLPSFSLRGRRDVEKGVFAGLGTEEVFPRLARRTALNIQRILLGEDAGTLPYAFPARERLTVNMATARAIGVYPPFSVLGEAELLDEEAVKVHNLRSLASTVREAVAANLDLAARARAVAAGEQEVRGARSDLLPQVGVSALGSVIDEDRARASFGSQAEQALTGTATLSQVIYAERAWSNLSVQKHLQTGREAEREAVRLDVTLDAAAGFLDVLRAKAAERIEKENLNLTRSNLELAKVRRSIGIAGPAEVFRWESAIANSRQVVLQAISRRQQAERALNRLLNRPLDEPFATEEVDLNDPVLITSDERFRKAVSNPWALSVFRSFMVKEGLANSVELRRLDAAIAAQERLLASANRSFWAPTAALSGDVTQFLAEGGAGKDPIAIPGLAGDAALPRKDDTDWGLGVNVSLPLFEGGLRFADRSRAIEDLARLEIERQATRERIALAIESAVLKIQASGPSIRLSQDARETALQNLDLVQDSYSLGVVSVIDLIDAQTSALVSSQVAANAVYDYLIDLMEMERAANSFDFFRTHEAQEAWFQRLEEYLREDEALRPQPYCAPEEYLERREGERGKGKRD